MSHARLVPCLGCARHVREDEPSCPFCSAVVAGKVGPARAVSPTPKNASRRSLYALGAALGVGSITLSGACGGSTSPTTTSQSAPPYGGVFLPDAGPDASESSDADTDANEASDASADTGSTTDAAEDAHDAGRVGPAPPYGAPVPPGDEPPSEPGKD